MNTLAELYCESHHVASDQFEHDVLKRCLYPQARYCKNLLTCFDAHYFDPDLELIRAAGHLTKLEAFDEEVAEYQYNSENCGRLRREWNLRLSVTRLRDIVLDTLDPAAPTSRRDRHFEEHASAA